MMYKEESKEKLSIRPFPFCELKHLQKIYWNIVNKNNYANEVLLCSYFYELKWEFRVLFFCNCKSSKRRGVRDVEEHGIKCRLHK